MPYRLGILRVSISPTPGSRASTEVTVKDPGIRSLLLKRFRSIPVERVEFGNPTFLVGRNGSGKSNFVDAFAFLAESMATPLKAVFDRRGGIEAVRNRTSGPSSFPPNLGICATFGPLNGVIRDGRYAFEVRALKNYGFEVLHEQCSVHDTKGRHHWFDRTADGGLKSSIRGLGLTVDSASLALPVVGGEARFAPVVQALFGLRTYAIEPARLREMQDPDPGLSLQPHGGNASSVLQEIGRRSQADLDRINDILGGIVPKTRSVRTVKQGKKLTLEFIQEWEPALKSGKTATKKRLRFEAFNMSDGTLRAVGLLAAVFQQPTPTLLVIEEPESTIHPGALPAILDLIRLAAKRTQVIVTTHSPEILDADWIKEENLRIVTWQEGATRVSRLGAAAQGILKDHLSEAGELMRSDLLERDPSFSMFSDIGSKSAQSELFETLG
jgi:predicted ATPase